MENVITLVITGASDGSRKPLRPSSKPSVPPVISPSIGFDTLTFYTVHVPHEAIVWR